MLVIVVDMTVRWGTIGTDRMKTEPQWMIKKIVRGRSINHLYAEIWDMKYICVFLYLDTAIGKTLTEVTDNFSFNVKTMGIDGMATHGARASTPLVLT